MSAKIATLIPCQVCTSFFYPYIIIMLSQSTSLLILIDDHFRVMLRSTTVSGSDYINASFVDVRIS